ncbi:MAG: beta-galactosidase, partial [Lachnospiraceae bacterium]|nr:beta-galactosidase [Lachnospiraceae bacterium]
MVYQFKEYQKSELLTNHLHMGGENQNGKRIDVTSLYFMRDGKPWIGVMGEYHFVRDNRENWYREFCKMKAGGITVAATYLFWIYHEETEGEFDFTGDRNIRQFILDAQRAGLDVFIRIGPWAHGECRNGGLPDWLLHKPYKLRDNNCEYMAKVRIWYEKIFEQVQGLFYADGGNIIGIQFENELVDDAAHLLALKELALDIGFQAPIYTVTGWNSAYGAKIPVDDVVPVFGAYPEAPWADSIEKLPLSTHYVFNKTRNDSAIGKDLIADVDESGWRLPYEKYPFATCELGGGIQITHHRRPLISGMDIYALSLVKLGSGNNLVGYYMYKG